MTINARAESVAPRVRAGDVHDLEITDLIAKTGQGVGRAGGMVVFVDGALPGESARARITLVKANYAVADLIEVLRPSADRREPPCAVFGRCGGCQLQHLAYPAQLAWKRSLVEQTLRRIGGLEGASVNPVRGMDDPYAYRNKMSLVIESTAEGTELGFYRTGTHDLVPIDRCPVMLPALDRTIGHLRAAIAAGGPVADALGQARHAVARVAATSGRGILSLTTPAKSAPLAAVASELARQLPDMDGVGNSYEPASANAVIGRKYAQLSGEREIEETIDGVRFRVSSASFFQINSRMVSDIFAYMAPHVVPGRAFVDLYCGAGTFALSFARRGARVIGIEENPHAVAEARANATRNGLDDRATFLAGRVEAMLRAPAVREALAVADVAFLDPPRKGSDPAALDAIVAARPAHVWYLSCNPATLARDLAHLVSGGYVLGGVQPFDMFPHTGHIEALATLDLRGAAPLTFEPQWGTADRMPNSVPMSVHENA